MGGCRCEHRPGVGPQRKGRAVRGLRRPALQWAEVETGGPGRSGLQLPRAQAAFGGTASAVHAVQGVVGQQHVDGAVQRRGGAGQRSRCAATRPLASASRWRSAAGHAAVARGAREVAHGLRQGAVQFGRTAFDGGGSLSHSACARPARQLSSAVPAVARARPRVAGPASLRARCTSRVPRCVSGRCGSSSCALAISLSAIASGLTL
jgi:hypothetical protein